MAEFNKGDRVLVQDSRKGKFKGIVAEDFNSHDEWYPIILDQDCLNGLTNIWIKGDRIPCRKGLSVVERYSEV